MPKREVVYEKFAQFETGSLDKAKDVVAQKENTEKAGDLIKLSERFGRDALLHKLKVKQRIENDAAAEPVLYAEQEEIQKDLFKFKENKKTKKYRDLEQKLAENQAAIDNLFIPYKQNIGRVGVNTVDAAPSTTQLMFGIIPKEGNLTEGDIREAQMFINKNPETMVSMLPPTSYIVTKINEKTGKASKIKCIGLPR